MSAGAMMTAPPADRLRTGLVLVLLSAVVWSFGGTIARFLAIPDPWTVVFWRSVWAAAFLFGFMLVRDGAAGTRALLLGLRLPAIGVALCFTTASITFVVALGHTSVANILFFQAAVPMIAALLARVLLGEPVGPATAAAIVAVMAGVAVMVSEGLGQGGSLFGSALSLVIAVAFALATVITRAKAGIRMVPAVFLGVALAALIAAPLAGSLAVSLAETGWLVAFGALNLGLGLALFVTGARLLPAAVAALIGTAEPVLGPLWVWMVHEEVPGARTLFGGAIVVAALVLHAAVGLRRG